MKMRVRPVREENFFGSGRGKRWWQVAATGVGGKAGSGQRGRGLRLKLSVDKGWDCANYMRRTGLNFKIGAPSTKNTTCQLFFKKRKNSAHLLH